MPAQDFFETEGFDEQLDVSASTRKFQTSIIVKQDPNKSGILSLLEKVEEGEPQPPVRKAPKTMRPRRQGGY